MSALKQSDYDIVIAGGGMVGASLACALAHTELRIALVEAVSLASGQQPSYDERGLALSLSSRRIFDALGVWQAVAASATPIRRVHVSDYRHFGKVRMDAADSGFEALGYVVIARELGRVLMETLQQAANVDIVCPARVAQLEQQPGQIILSLADGASPAKLSCSLLVVADGTHSSIREQLGISTELTDYGQTAIVSNLTPQLPHKGTAFERFTGHGPLALLPLSENRCALVFSVPAENADYFSNIDEEAFLAEVQKCFGRRLGRLGKIGTRRAYPIIQLQVAQQAVGRAVLLGNAAHTVHPNGAQGFNLCLRDVAGLAEHLLQAQAGGIDAGNHGVLDAYVSSRRDDQERVSRQCHAMTSWFYNTHGLKAAARNIAMTLVDLIPCAREGLMHRGMGLWGRQPAMVRGVEL